MSTVNQPRRVERLVTGQPTTDGAGVKLTRVLTQDLQQRLDPFLMLDNFASDDPDDYGAGFPDHPHRGFETVTYMIEGRMRHRDSAGHEGLLQNGGVQWMTAGRGLVHSEMPEQEGGRMEGFQLWLNLPAKDKMCEPWYRDIQSAEIPRVHHRRGRGRSRHRGAEPERGRCRATRTHGAALPRPALPGRRGRVRAAAAGEPQRFSLRVPGPGGSARRARQCDGGAAAQHGAAGQRRATAWCCGQRPAVPSAARALLIAGKPLREPIAQYGPFVMNTREQLMTAVDDFQRGRFT